MQVSPHHCRPVICSGIAEFCVLYLVLPVAYYLEWLPVHKFIVLAVVFGLCMVVLLRDNTFNRNTFGFNNFTHYKPIILRFLIVAGASVPLVYYLMPDSFFSPPGGSWLLWGMIMIFYPIFSIIPQTFLVRVYFFHRFSSWFSRPWVLYTVNGFVFGFMHIIFHNWLAVALTFVAGIAFARTYDKSRSLMVSAFEHMLYGNWVFTVGAGSFFYAPTP